MKSAVIMLYHVYVLIDTWWNVNKPCGNLYISCCGCFNRYMVECEFKTWLHNTTGIRVLIDTWWNVNLSVKTAVVIFSRFNRYMVECEFSKELGSIDRLHGFNRYMVECEFIKGLSVIKNYSSFNRYMVECESANLDERTYRKEF